MIGYLVLDNFTKDMTTTSTLQTVLIVEHHRVLYITLPSYGQEYAFQGTVCATYKHTALRESVVLDWGTPSHQYTPNQSGASGHTIRDRHYEFTYIFSFGNLYILYSS